MPNDEPTCDCNACEQARLGQISRRTGRIPSTKRLVEHDERDPRVVEASRRLRHEESKS